MSYESARERLTRLAPLAEKLNAATDAATENLKAIEAELEHLSIGLDVRLDEPLISRLLNEDEVEELGWQPTGMAAYENSYLSYGRHGARWMFLVRRVVERETADGPWDEHGVNEFPLVGASRDLRMAAWEQIDELIDQIAAEAQRKLDSLNDAVAKRK